MISTNTLLVLRKPGGVQVRLESGKRPAAHAGDGVEEIDPHALSTDDILQFLFVVGGGRHVDALGPTPTQWRTRVGALGVVSITATRRGDVVEVSFARTEAAP